VRAGRQAITVLHSGILGINNILTIKANRTPQRSVEKRMAESDFQGVNVASGGSGLIT
jgi:hypothetical protein